jgi:hypothetical protein
VRFALGTEKGWARVIALNGGVDSPGDRTFAFILRYRGSDPPEDPEQERFHAGPGRK